MEDDEKAEAPVTDADVQDAFDDAHLQMWATYLELARQKGVPQEEIELVERDFRLYASADQMWRRVRSDHTHADVVSVLRPDNLWVFIAEQMAAAAKELQGPGAAASLSDALKRRSQRRRSRPKAN